MNALVEQPFTQTETSVLRFITAGSVDDGKSTLIGRLLFDSKGVFADQLDAIARSKYKRTEANELDLSLLTDGLEAEREQGITIDVAYRYFATPARKFIVADAPGHEQYTRNMVTGASTAQAAIILIDATRVKDGELLVQTKRHSALAALLGIKHIVVAVNKMDLTGWDQALFERIRDSYAALAAQLGIAQFHILPVSALKGDNVVKASAFTPWYAGPPLLGLLEQLPLDAPVADSATRLYVQWVIRHGGSSINDFRGYAGQVSSGQLAVGAQVRVLPSGAAAHIARLHRGGHPVDHAVAGDSVVVELDQDIDVSRGDVFVTGEHPVHVDKTFDAELCWLDQQPLSQARTYWLKLGTRLTQVKLKAVHSRRDIHTLGEAQVEQQALQMNDIGKVTLTARDALVLDRYRDLPGTGAFILIDAATHQTAAAGMIQ